MEYTTDQILRVQRFSGHAIAPFIPALARLRIAVFREFPYLYLGNEEYEAHYLKTYTASPDSVIVIVFDGDQVVGASTGLPLADETPEFQQPFREHGYDIDRIFYFGESVLLPAYRGLGLGSRFFMEREAHARALGRFHWTCFCAVERPTDHPRRPPDYRPHDPFWQRRGYIKHPELCAYYSWRDLDEAAESPKPMVFWLKRQAAP